MSYRFQPISAKAKLDQIVAAMNRNFSAIDKEAVTKLIRQSGTTPAMLSGQLPNGTFGQILYDKTGLARIHIGFHKSNGKPVIAVSKDGQDVMQDEG